MNARLSSLPPLEELRAELEYDPETGSFFWKKFDKGRRMKVGSFPKDGKKWRPKLTFKNRDYQIARLAYYIHTGHDPLYIRHRNGDICDCRFENLMVVSLGELIFLRPWKGKDRGIYRHADGGWVATIRRNGIDYYLGKYRSRDEAKEAFWEGAEFYYGELADIVRERECTQSSS